MEILRLLPLSAALLVIARPAEAAPQVWPFQFDPNLAPDASAIQADLSQGAASLPPLPVSELQTLQTDNATMTLWFWPENAALLQAINTAGPGPMTWPSTPVLCAKHAAFAMPALLTASPSPACTTVNTQIGQELGASTLSACSLVEQPELYVFGYSPQNVTQDVGNIEDMIGVAGEALTHAGPPLQGILPSDWVPTMRAIVDKIRYPTLLAGLQQADAAYGAAASALAANASCFDPGALSTLQAELAGLSGEVAAVTSFLQTLEKQGEDSAAHSNVCLAAHSRSRLALPYPGLTDAERRFIGFWLGAVYWRMRGGGLIPLGQTQEARLLYVGNGFGQIGNLLGGTDGAAVSGPFVSELILDGWSQYQGMGSGSTGLDKYTALVGMTERGQRQAQAGINALEPLGYDTADLLTGGLQMGPGYYFAYYPLASYRYGITMPSPYSNFIDWPTAVGEFNIGGALGMGMARVLLAGKPTNQPPSVKLCSGRACGDDGCGGSCGSCAAGQTCDASGQCVVVAGDAGDSMDAGVLPGADSGASASSGGSGGGGSSGSSGSSGSGGGNETPPDPYAGGSGANSGCGCHTARGTTRAPLLLGLVALGVLAARRRRKPGVTSTAALPRCP